MNDEKREFAKIGLVFSAALTVLCGVIASGWKSDELFIALGIHPFGLGFIFWPLIGYLLAGAKTDSGRSLCLCAVTFYNYWVVERLTAPDDGARSLIERLWGDNKLGLTVLVAFYVGGQLVIVLPKVWERRRRARAI